MDSTINLYLFSKKEPFLFMIICKDNESLLLTNVCDACTLGYSFLDIRTCMRYLVELSLQSLFYYILTHIVFSLCLTTLNLPITISEIFFSVHFILLEF